MLILGIESSCDETAAAVVRSGRKILANVVASQIEVHAPYGVISVAENSPFGHPHQEALDRDGPGRIGEIDDRRVALGRLRLRGATAAQPEERRAEERGERHLSLDRERQQIVSGGVAAQMWRGPTRVHPMEPCSSRSVVACRGRSANPRLDWIDPPARGSPESEQC